MRNFFNLLTLLVLVLVANNSFAQTCCSGSTTAPEVTPGLHGALIPLDQNTPGLTASVAASSDLPTLEFLITKRHQTALDGQGMADTTGGGGDVIIGAVDATGVFKPQDKSRYGISLAVGDTFDLTAVGYDLPIIKTLTDSLLNGYSGANKCCEIFVLMAAALGEPSLAGFCDSVNNAGIFNSNDINDMEDVLVIFDAFSTGQVSVGSMVWTLQTINNNGQYISSDCGGTGANNFVPYGVNRDKKYGYVADNSVAVRQLSDVSLFMLFPNPVVNNTLNLNFSTTKETTLTINVVNTLGERIISKDLGTMNGDYYSTLSFENVPAGIYMVELTDGKNSQTQKVVVN